MRSQLSAQLDKIISGVLIITVLLIPLILTNLTTEFYETPKLIFLLIVICLLLVLRSLSWITQGKVLITRTPIDIPLLLLLSVMVLSSLLNDQVRYIAFFGNFPKIHGSTVSWILYIIFFFLATAHLRTRGQVKALLYAFLASATVLAVVTLLSYFGVYLPFKMTQVANFTPAGTSFSAAAWLVLALPVVILAPLSKDKKFLPSGLVILLELLFTLTIAMVGDFSTLIGVVVVVGVIVFAQRKQFRAKLSSVLLPLLLPVLIFALSNVPFGGALHQKAISFPREVQLPFDTSWKVAASSFRDNPFLGSGPSTYLFDFTYYKPIEYNATNLWNIRFDTAFNEFLQLFATTGLLGLLAFIFLIGVILSLAWRGLKSQEDELLFALSVSAITAVVLLALHPSTVISIVATIIILAMMFALEKNRSEKVEEIMIGIKASRLTDSSLITGDALPVILLLPIVIIVLIALWNGSRMVMADYYHRVALDAASTRGLDTYNNLILAEQLNPNVDLYHTDLAQTNFALANAIATAKGPTQSSPSGSLTDTDKQNIQTLLSQAINEGKAGVTLSPLNAQDWEILASIYRQISGVAQNALQFSLDSYGHAIQRDPLNPLLRLEVGGVYYSVKNYDLAIRFFTDSVNLKPDFANGYYNLAIAYQGKGDYQSALAAAQPILNLVDPKSPDYQTATKLVNDLENQAKQASSSGQKNQTGNATPPAAQQNGALEQNQLPKVINLPQPSSIATPSAVKK